MTPADVCHSSLHPATDARSFLQQYLIAVVVVGLALSVALATLLGGRMALAAAVGIALFLLTACKPVMATYVYLLTLPFLAGVGRERLIPGIRPNEALLVLLVAGACVGGYIRYLNGKPLDLRLRPVDGALAAFVLLSTLWPLTSMMIRGATPESTDLLAVLPICKLVGLLLLVRATVRTDAQRRCCIRIVAWTACVIAVIAFLQTRGFGPVVAALDVFWVARAEEVSTERGSTTLAHPIATGDFIVFGLALVIAAGMRGVIGRREQIVVGSVLSVGVLAAGQFSTWLAALVATVIFLRRYPELRRRAVIFAPAIGALLLLGAPVVAGRLSGFGGELGVPLSWRTRWDNVANLYWPEIADGGYLAGISPDSVKVPPDLWRDQIYLESGYVQLLWVGGVPLLVGFVWFAAALLRRIRTVATRSDAAGACAAGLEAAWWVVLVLSVIDIHLFLRGSGDLVFVLIAITTRCGATARGQDGRCDPTKFHGDRLDDGKLR